MDILIPVSLGIAINLIFYAIGITIFKKPIVVNLILFLTSSLMVYSSYIVGAWTGIGMLVIALGMLITAVFFTVRSLICLITLAGKPV